LTGGEALNPDVREKWKSQTGLELHEGYGQSETVSAMPQFSAQQRESLTSSTSPFLTVLSITPVMGNTGNETGFSSFWFESSLK
jgi:acyl-coenzyme A synthetase/AMP-(fatty) acid ligase